MKRLFVLMVLLSSFFLSSMAGLINFISFPEGQTWYYSGGGAFKSIMMAEVYFFKNSKGEEMVKYKPHICLLVMDIKILRSKLAIMTLPWKEFRKRNMIC